MTPGDPLRGLPAQGTERLVTLCAEGVCLHEPPHRPLPVLLLGDSHGSVLTRWVLSEEERVAVAAGADLWIWQESIDAWPGQFPPILPTFEEPRIGDACTGCRHMEDHTAGEALNRCPFCRCLEPFLVVPK